MIEFPRRARRFGRDLTDQFSGGGRSLDAGAEVSTTASAVAGCGGSVLSRVMVV